MANVAIPVVTVNNIFPFDATQDKKISFNVNTQFTMNEIKIEENINNVWEQVYHNTSNTYNPWQIIPQNTLQNGKKYRCAFKVSSASMQTNYSQYEYFSCYTTPNVTLNIADGDTITTVAYTNSTLPYIDISNIPHQADMHVEVGIIPDKNGGRVYFPFDFVNATLTPNYRYVSGYYYSSKWQGSVGIQISNNKLYLDTTWTRIYDDGSVLTCSTSGGTLNKVDAKIFVYTKYVEK